MLVPTCLVWLAAACSLLPLDHACPGALLEGTLVRGGPQELLVLQPEVNVAYPVEWPDGWSVREEAGILHLLDGADTVGAEGDRFWAGGGFTSGPDEIFQPCGRIEITPADA
jgi:hypothetical protein